MDSEKLMMLISGIKAENKHVALVWGLIMLVYHNYSTIRVYLMSK